MGVEIDYRPFAASDLPELQALWIAETDWGPLTPAMWQRFVLDAPLGAPAGVVAVERSSGHIVGQFPFTRALVQIDGHVHRAFRPSALIMSKRISGMLNMINPFGHPVYELYRHDLAEIASEGSGLVYMIPDPRWKRFLRLLPGLQTGKFPLYSRPLPLEVAPVLPEDVRLERVEQFDERVDALWRVASAQHRVSLVRDAAALRWKIGTGEWDVVGVARGGAMIGLAASRRWGDRQWLVGDIFAMDLDGALRATLTAVTLHADQKAREATPEKPLRKIALAVTAAMLPAVSAVGFQRDDYDFQLVVKSLGADVRPEAIAPERWYISAND